MAEEVKREVKFIAFEVKDLIIIVLIAVVFCIADYWIRSQYNDWRIGRLAEEVTQRRQKEGATQAIFNQVSFPANLANALTQAGWSNIRVQKPSPIPPNIQDNFEEGEKEEKE